MLRVALKVFWSGKMSVMVIVNTFRKLELLKASFALLEPPSLGSHLSVLHTIFAQLKSDGHSLLI